MQYKNYINRFRNNFTLLFSLLIFILLGGCVSPETPRDADKVSTSNTQTLLSPSITDADRNGISMRYAQISFGFDPSCNPNRLFSYEMNKCAKLPQEVKDMAIDHCNTFSKKAVFLGNRTNWLQMTISDFRCETR